jgi:uncharacterized membrane protein
MDALKKMAPLGWVLLLGFFSWQMLLITLQYIPFHDDAAFLQIKTDYLDIRHWKVAFIIHVFSSMFVLVAGFTQFSPWFLKKKPIAHRYIGRLYVFVVLFVTGPASFIMALYANGGISSRIAFTILSVLWMLFTALAWRKVVQKKFRQHKEFMLRSYALTFSAITLRCWKWILVYLFHPRPMDVYMLVAWLGFIPNLIFIEWWIRRKRHH